MLTGWTFFRIPSRVPLSMSCRVHLRDRCPQQSIRLNGKKNGRVVSSSRSRRPRYSSTNRSNSSVWQVALVFGQQRPLHPLHHVFARRQDMRIDDQPHLRSREAAAIQQTRIRLGFSTGCERRQSPNADANGSIGRELVGDAVGQRIVLGRHLERELPDAAQRAASRANQRFVVVDPVQGGVRKDQVVADSAAGDRCGETPRSSRP